MALKTPKESAIKCLKQETGKKQVSKKIESCLELLQTESEKDGLSADDVQTLVTFTTSTKLASTICCKVLTCFIPETKISNESMKQIIFWFVTESGGGKIACSVEKKFFQWLIAVVYYELTDLAIVESYYYSFLFMLDKAHLQSSVCKLLSLISKPEDAKRWVVQKILAVQNINGPKPYTTALLNLLKSYRPDVVPERIPVSNFSYGNSFFDDALKKAYLRNLESHSENSMKKNNLEWNSWQLFEGNSLTRLIPAPETLSLETEFKTYKRKLKSVTEVKSLVSLGTHMQRIECPAQSLSLLTNVAGYHIVAFSDSNIKSRFSHKLYHTLCRVFLLELEPYSKEEKSNFLRSIKELQEYIHQSIPTVTTFLFHYLLIWDGESFCREILGLLEWIEVRDETGLEKYVFSTLRQIFISSESHLKCLIIDTMGKLLMNLLVTNKREKNFFKNDYEEMNLTKSIQSISSFTSELITQGLLWNSETKSRSLLGSALNFYKTLGAVEQVGDLPIILILPPTLVYKCLFSGSRVCIERCCSLLVSLQIISVERLYILGVFEDFAKEVQLLNIYILDYYRFLWSDIAFRDNEESFIFHDKNFSNMFLKFKRTYGGQMEKIFGVEFSSTFWEPRAKDVLVSQTMESFPSIRRLKEITEERLLKVSVLNKRMTGSNCLLRALGNHEVTGVLEVLYPMLPENGGSKWVSASDFSVKI